jgi:hypothetical protein
VAYRHQTFKKNFKKIKRQTKNLSLKSEAPESGPRPQSSTEPIPGHSRNPEEEGRQSMSMCK